MRTPDETLAEAQRLLVAGRPFHAHEVFEDAWKSAGAEHADLWKGLAQLAVGVTHRLRGNAVGADHLLRRAADALASQPAPYPYGIDIAGLVAWARSPDVAAMPRLQLSSLARRPTR